MLRLSSSVSEGEITEPKLSSTWRYPANLTTDKCLHLTVCRAEARNAGRLGPGFPLPIDKVSVLHRAEIEVKIANLQICKKTTHSPPLDGSFTMTKSTSPDPARKKIRRSRLGCHQCKSLKIKCSEERPVCANCARIGKPCDYTLKLTWGGRPYKNKERRKSAVVADPHRSLKTPSVLTFVNSEFDHHKVKAESSDGTQPVEPVEPVVKAEPIDNSLENSHNLANLAHSIDSASMSLDLISNGANNVNLRHSEIFNSFMNSQVAHSQMAQSTLLESDASHLQSPLLVDLYDNYAADISRIESALPEEPKSNFVTDYVHPSFWARRSNRNSAGNLPVADNSGEHLDFVTTPTPLLSDPSQFGKILEEENLDPLALFNHSLANIPSALTPLPELLMEVPYYRQLFHFWINVAAPSLVPAPSDIYKDNPFKVLVPQMAMHYPGVLTSILAFAARARDRMDGENRNHRQIIDQLLGRSCNELLKQLQDKEEATSDGTLAIILLLSCYEVMNSDDFEKHRTHTTGASQIISARSVKYLKNHDSPGSDRDSETSASSFGSLAKIRDESDIAFFLMRWFVYVDVIGALSATRGHENYLRTYRKRGGYVPVEEINTIDIHSASDASHKTDIDYLLGFDVKLLPHFINIALLIFEVEKYQSLEDADPHNLPLHIITHALELKERFTQGFEEGEAKRQSTIDLLIESKLRLKKVPRSQSSKNIKALVQQDNILRATNKLFFNTGLLNLYRRVLLIPRLSPLVQDLADNAAEITECGLESGSPAEFCTIFCHFCAACETLSVEKRHFYLERFTKLAHAGHAGATKSLVVMNRCWETGKDWITVANELDIDLVLM